ncbi:MAG: glycoside hydrolase family 2 protein [Tannerella sp.]|jgi:beta-mannosidase|nr:glycoside hydrolase family 2 protein [Tannerella sp.]
MKRKLYVALMATMLCLPVNQARADERVRQEISEDWKLKQVRGNNWYAATVPGVVQLDLLNNGLIEDPFFRLNERSIQWVDKEDWEYKTIFRVLPDLFAKDNIELEFKGLDTYADVYLNDSCILKADNMFREWRVKVKELLKKDDNVLRIYFHSPIKVDLPKFDAIHYPIEAGNDQSENGGILNKKLSVFARKAGYHYGWDWGPRIVTSGIWRPVYLTGWNNARIENIHYIQKDVTAKKAALRARAEVIADKSVSATLLIRVEGVRNTWQKDVRLNAGKNIIELDMNIPQPKLWWSNGLGEPYLYPFTATLSVNEPVVIADTQTDRIGLRSLKVIYEKDAGGHAFHFELNGVKIFAKGANYIPQDNLLPRVTDADYEKTVLAAVDARMNMLRVWGGGIYENEIFYDLCDRHGILIWQDFMFACSVYPMTPLMIENIRQEAIENVVRLRNHPCIALWCGNNENHTAWFNWGWMRAYERLGVLDELRKDYKDVFHQVLPEAVATYDPTAFYWPSSPYAGNPDAQAETGREILNADGDAHYWGVWHGHDSIANYNVIRARFFSEYGFQSFPEYQSVLKYAPEEQDHDIYSDVMMAHQRGGSQANALIEWYLLNEYRKPKDFPSFLYMGQLLQGDAIKTAIEAHRRDMPYCMGSLFWQHNDCWPVASWSSRDYYGRWKAQHYFARKAYDDILVSPVSEDGFLNVYVVSDRLNAVRGALDVRIIELKSGQVVYERKRNVTLPANSSSIRFKAPIETLLIGRDAGEIVVHARFTETQGKTMTIRSNNYFLSRYKNIDFPKAAIHASSVASRDGYDVTVKSDAFARGVFLSIEGIDNFFSDNYFDLLPGEEVTIHVTTSLNKADFDKQLKIEHLADAY